MTVQGITVKADQCGNEPTGSLLVVSTKTKARRVQLYIAEPTEAFKIFEAIVVLISREAGR